MKTQTHSHTHAHTRAGSEIMPPAAHEPVAGALAHKVLGSVLCVGDMISLYVEDLNGFLAADGLTDNSLNVKCLREDEICVPSFESCVFQASGPPSLRVSAGRAATRPHCTPACRERAPSHQQRHRCKSSKTTMRRSSSRVGWRNSGFSTQARRTRS